MAHYVDTSALVKLVVAEAESEALAEWLRAPGREIVTSDLARTELLRTVRRCAPGRVPRARQVLDVVGILAMPTLLFEAAARLDPLPLRSLDALHLAAALDLGDDLDALVAYDDRLASAARANGVPVIAPR